MSMSQAYIKDALKRIEEKLDRLLEEQALVTPNVPELTEAQIKMAKVRAARKVNTGEGGRG